MKHVYHQCLRCGRPTRAYSRVCYRCNQVGSSEYISEQTQITLLQAHEILHEKVSPVKTFEVAMWQPWKEGDTKRVVTLAANSKTLKG